MFPIILGFVVALAFEAVAFATYGSVALTDYAWVGMVAWGLIGAGVIVYAVRQPVPAWLRGLGGRLRTLVEPLVNPQSRCRSSLDALVGPRR
jgi:hypothetical protein